MVFIVPWQRALGANTAVTCPRHDQAPGHHEFGEAIAMEMAEDHWPV